MSVYYLDALANDDIAEDGKEGEDGGERCLAVYYEEGHVVDLEAIGKVADTRAASVGMRDYNHLVASIDEFLVWVRTSSGICGETRPYTGQLVHVTLHSSYSSQQTYTILPYANVIPGCG